MNRILLGAAPLLLFSIGSALAEVRSVEVASFTAVSVETEVTASVKVGGEQSVTIDADNSADLEAIQFEVEAGQLRVWREPHSWDFSSPFGNSVKVTISTPSIQALSARSGSRVETTGLNGDSLELFASSAASISARQISARDVRIEAWSAGTIRANGICTALRVEVSSAGQVDAGDLECVDLTVNASSAGRALLFAKGNANAHASSAAIVIIAGKPKHIDHEINAGGFVDILD